MEVKKIKCPYCGSLNVTTNMDGTYTCNSCEKHIKPELLGQLSGIASNLVSSSTTTIDNIVNKGMKSRVIAAALAIFLGVIGAQYFYLGEKLLGFVVLLVTLSSFVTVFGFLLSIIWGIISGIMLLTMANDKFNEKYNHA